MQSKNVLQLFQQFNAQSNSNRRFNNKLFFVNAKNAVPKSIIGAPSKSTYVLSNVAVVASTTVTTAHFKIVTSQFAIAVSAMTECVSAVKINYA